MAEEQKQEPEKPAKKPFALSLPIMIGIGVGVIVIMFGISIFAVNMMVNKIINAKIPAATAPDSNAAHGKSEQNVKDEEETLGVEKGTYVETGRITTNPKGSSSFVVINLGLVYRDKGEAAQESGGHEEGKGTPDVSIKDPQLEALIRQTINNRIGEMPVEEIQMLPRDSLITMFKQDLSPVFKGGSKYLRSVILKEFIVQ